MRIGVDATAFRSIQAGVARYLRNMLRNMMEQAPSVEFVLYAPSAIGPVDLPPGNWRVQTDERSHVSFGSLWVQTRLPAFLDRDNVDVFWGQNSSVPLRLRRPCYRVLTVHDLTAVLYPRSMVLKHRMAAAYFGPRSARAADCVVAVSRYTAELVRRHFHVPADKLRVITEGCESVFQPVAASEAARVVQDQFGLQPGYLLCVGTIEPRKDHVGLLSAVRRIGARAPVLVLVGSEGWRCRGIMREIDAMVGSGSVRFMGRVTDEQLVALYGAALFSVYPSLYEGFGLPVLESMACGCPVLCSDSSSLPEVGGSAARYFRAGDIVDMSRKLDALISDDRTLREMSDAGIRHARTFSFRRAAAEFLDVVGDGLRRTF